MRHCPPCSVRSGICNNVKRVRVSHTNFKDMLYLNADEEYTRSVGGKLKYKVLVFALKMLQLLAVEKWKK